MVEKEVFEMTYKEQIDNFVKGGYKCHDNTCNGKCSKCGECCGIILPIDQEDADIMMEYIVKNKIFTQKQTLIMTQKLQCPYYNGNKEKGCSIYNARPKICRIFQCDKQPCIKDAMSLKNTYPVDMWEFANAIEKEMLRNGINKETRKTIN